MLVQTRNGQNITLDQEINRGGEARIWSVQRAPQQLAKLYFAPTAQHEAKLHAMLANPPRQPRDHAAIAWPSEMLYQENRFVGFLMPRVYDCNSIFRIYNPMLRHKLPEPYSWNAFLHRTARNLAAALELVHDRGHMVGDLNESNILVTPDARVTLVDADSFQVRGEQDVIHHCTVAKAEFLPPELSGADLRTIERTTAQDHFGLAVLIWYLLMEGFHPFQGVLQRRHSVERVHLYCKDQGFFPYQHYRVLPPPKAPALEQLHPALAEAFYSAFVSGYRNPAARPDAKEWQERLIQAENTLIPCAENKSHYYYGQLQRCPVCHPLRRRLTTSQRAYGWLILTQARLAQVRPALLAAPTPNMLTAKARRTVHLADAHVQLFSTWRSVPQGAQRVWQQVQPSLAFSAHWIAINLAGAGGGSLLATALWLLLTTWTGWMPPDRTPLMLCGALFGALLGAVQWRMLREHISKWGGSQVAWIMGAAIIGLTAAAGSAPFLQAGESWWNRSPLGDVRPLLSGLLLGALLGVGQWLLFRYHLRRRIESRPWILSSVAGWGVAGQAWLAGQHFALDWRSSLSSEYTLAAALLSGLIGVAFYGLLTSRQLWSGLNQSVRMRRGRHAHGWRFNSGIDWGRRSNQLMHLPREIKKWGWLVLTLVLVLGLLQWMLGMLQLS
ncbi:MAG: hypothetical protein H6641_23475 [Caldilineaceae bacterium]|nr:hypothetical protein [Caldilineaceae bacterium]